MVHWGLLRQNKKNQLKTKFNLHYM